MPTIPIQDDLVFVIEEEETHESKRKKKDKHKSKKHKHRNYHIPKHSVVDDYNWEILPNEEGERKSIIRLRRTTRDCEGTINI